MRVLCLDTNVYSEFRRGDKRIIQEVIACDRIIIPATVLGELRAGFLNGSKAQENLRVLKEFLRSTAVQVGKTGDETANLYALITQQLKKEGHPIPVNDIWIAACAMEHRIPIFTLDRHFGYVQGLDVLN